MPELRLFLLQSETIIEGHLSPWSNTQGFDKKSLPDNEILWSKRRFFRALRKDKGWETSWVTKDHTSSCQSKAKFLLRLVSS